MEKNEEWGTVEAPQKETEETNKVEYEIEGDPPSSEEPKQAEPEKKEVPELAHIRSARYIKHHKLDPVDAEVMAMELELAELFEIVATQINPKLAAKWLRRELLRVLNYNKKSLKKINLDEQQLIELLQLVEEKTISETTGQKLMEKLIGKPFSPKEYVEKNNLTQLSSDNELEKICKQVIKEHSKAVEDYKSGNTRSFQYLIGQVMRETKGKAEPSVVNKLMKKLI